MPLINGCKYSCEPCIRGHRATSCAHTDRILIEVRKPGRPLESCGHDFSTCQCGKVAALFSVGNSGNGFDASAINNPVANMSTAQEPSFFVDAQPVQPKQKTAPEMRKKGPSRTKSKSRGQSRVEKKSRTPSESSSKSSPLIRGFQEASTFTATPLTSASVQSNKDPRIGSIIHQTPRSTGSLESAYFPPLPADLIHPYGRPQVFSQQPRQSPNPSSKIEHILSPQMETSTPGGHIVRSQYNTMTDNSAWRAA